MGRQKIKKGAEKKISECFDKATINKDNPKISRGYIKKARRTAMHFNLKIPRDAKKKFCRKCNSLFDSNNCKRRIKKGFLVMHCLKCGNLARYKIHS